MSPLHPQSLSFPPQREFETSGSSPIAQVITASTSHSLFFFFNDTATTEIYTLSLHDALPILEGAGISGSRARRSPQIAAARASLASNLPGSGIPSTTATIRPTWSFSARPDPVTAKIGRAHV